MARSTLEPVFPSNLLHYIDEGTLDIIPGTHQSHIQDGSLVDSCFELENLWSRSQDFPPGLRGSAFPKISPNKSFVAKIKDWIFFPLQVNIWDVVINLIVSD
ncbi:hypothetical protein AVEN_197319-1 [Araneus ventricosus]|uniref:Uncharacterized protein n=1 Tax=Araneus ventricosus TaxID=182803 RepID=A0A4Y2EYH3_ARAVE|nr:hypothetical protein AVEN_197319-1 [Araneus ventricosus]